MRVLLSAPRGMKRKFRSLEIPAYPGYTIDQVFDESFNELRLDWQLNNGKWSVSGRSLPSSEKYFVTLKGSLPRSALDELVSVRCPEDPKRGEGTDEYWIHSAIRDMGILEKIYSELSVDRVSTSVKVGVERSFASSIPVNTRRWLEARAKADSALKGEDRQAMFYSWREYRLARRRIGQLAPAEIAEIIHKLVSPTVFLVFIVVSDPYRIENIIPTSSGIVPDAIGVNVQTDLNFRRGAAAGNLIFRKKDFGERIRKVFDALDKKGRLMHETFARREAKHPMPVADNSLLVKAESQWINIVPAGRRLGSCRAMVLKWNSLVMSHSASQGSIPYEERCT